MSRYSGKQIELMKRACLLCDNSPLKVKTGCLIMKEDLVIGEGWNNDNGVHAEVMALKQAKSGDSDLVGSIVYVSRFPCMKCAELLRDVGVREIYYMSDHFTSGNEAMQFLRSSVMIVKQIPKDIVWD